MTLSLCTQVVPNFFPTKHLHKLSNDLVFHVNIIKKSIQFNQTNILVAVLSKLTSCFSNCVSVYNCMNVFHHFFIHYLRPGRNRTCPNIHSWFIWNFTILRPAVEGGQLMFIGVQIIQLHEKYLSLLQSSQRFGMFFLRPCIQPCPQEHRYLETGEILLAQCSIAFLSLLSEDDAFCKFTLSTQKSLSLSPHAVITTDI